MVFYRVEVELENAENTEVSVRSETEAYFQRRQYAFHITFSSIRQRGSESAVLCAAVKNERLTEQMIDDYLSYMGYAYKSVRYHEITAKDYGDLLDTAERNDFIVDSENITDKLDFPSFSQNRRRSSLDHSEALVSDGGDREALDRRFAGSLVIDSFFDEFDRIEGTAPTRRAIGHPVHYLIGAQNKKMRRELTEALISSLYRKYRLQSQRCVTVHLTVGDYFDDNALRRIYQSSAGGSVLLDVDGIDPNKIEDCEETNDLFEVIGRMTASYRKEVLTFLCIAQFNAGVQNLLAKHLTGISVLPITEQPAKGERAKGYLAKRADEVGLTANEALLGQIDMDGFYSPDQLNVIFEKWYEHELSESVFPLYEGLAFANRAVKKEEKHSDDSADGELDEMIGLTEAKALLRQVIDFHSARQRFGGAGEKRPSMHMVFTGNPGSAKTTVARLFAKIMKAHGLLKRDVFHEVGRADLVGRYVGHTAPLVRTAFRIAQGGVLFIDEAYSLVDDRNGLFGDEAINTIVQEMENARSETVVIFAGYPDKMEQFLNKNPGLRSRIAFHIPFADYSPDELYAITELIAKREKVTLDEGVRDKLLPIFDAASRRADFGNGRFARNLFEKARMKQATRLLGMDEGEVMPTMFATLTAEDFEAPPDLTPVKRMIGFGG